MEDMRKSKGLQIAQTKTIQEVEGGYIVPSQTSNKKYFVSKHDEKCTCPDCTSRNVKCKHVFAVEYYLQKITTDHKGAVQVEIKRLTYPQAWHAYNQAQTNEVNMFDKLLRDLVETIEEPEPKQGAGRPNLSLREQLFCSTQKVYSQLSSRRAKSLYNNAKDKGLLGKAPHSNAVNKFLSREDITPVMHRLITLSAAPLRAVETAFAVDSSGFRTTKFNDYCREKHNIRKEHKWIKAHICCGVKTNIITGAVITEGNANDSPMLPQLVAQTSQNFNAEEYLADKGYCSRSNMQFIADNGAKPFILFRKDTKPKSFGASAWRNAWHYFSLHQAEFMQHYHQRSNVESTFNMVKAKFGDGVKSKKFTAQQNELLAKILCHNIVVLIHEMFALGIEAKFG